MNILKMITVSVVSFTAVAASARVIECSIPKNLTKLTHQIQKIQMTSQGPYAFDSVIKKLGKSAEFRKSGAFQSMKTNELEEFNLYDEKEISRTLDKEVTESISLVKNLETKKWSFVRTQKTHYGSSSCIEGEDFDCYSISEVIGQTSVQCSDTQDLVKPSEPYDYEQDDPCSPNYRQ